MKACDLPMKEFISLCLPGQVDGRFGVVHHDEAGPGLFLFFLHPLYDIRLDRRLLF